MIRNGVGKRFKEGKENVSESFYGYENEPTGSSAVECGRVGGEHEYSV
jgi:hypothetical protein